MRQRIIEWIYDSDMYCKYDYAQLENMSDDELMDAHNEVVADLCRDS